MENYGRGISVQRDGLKGKTKAVIARNAILTRGEESLRTEVAKLLGMSSDDIKRT